jgi:thymidine kinase
MSLHITLGPMYSGKTSKLIDTYFREGLRENKSLVIDYNIDNQDEGYYIGKLLNHDSKSINSVIKTKQLMQYDILSLITPYHIVMINECQFFGDLVEFVFYCMKMEKTIYLYGLDGDFQRQPMGNVLDLIPYCNSIEKLNGKCQLCNEKSIFSHRVTENKEQVLFDHKQYIPLCRKCYHKKNDVV